jgi:hypothetical protein
VTRPSFDIPGLADKQLRQADRDAAQTRKEVHGPTLAMELSDQTQHGDALHPHGVPEDLGPVHIQVTTGERALPVSQAIQYNPRTERIEAFNEAIASAADQGLIRPAEDGVWRDRRGLEEHRPHGGAKGGWQADNPAAAEGRLF